MRNTLDVKVADDTEAKSEHAHLLPPSGRQAATGWQGQSGFEAASEDEIQRPRQPPAIMFLIV